MNVGFESPAILWLLPLALLPFLFLGQERQPYPSLAGVVRDAPSIAAEMVLRISGALAISALVVGASGPFVKGGRIERTGEGAHIVLLIDRSKSMDDTFAGRQPNGDDESKSAAARRIISNFVKDRKHDRFGVAAFSTSPVHILALTDRKDAVLAAVDAIERPGLAYTDIGRGLAMALSIQAADTNAAPRAVVLVSDGAAVIHRKVQDKLRTALVRRPVNLYWLFLRTEGTPGIFYSPKADESDTPQSFPERHLHKFFQGLGVPYKAFEVEKPSAVGEALAEIGKLERRALTYFEEVPKRDLSFWPFLAAALGLVVLTVAKLYEAPRTMGSRVGLFRAGAAGSSQFLEFGFKSLASPFFRSTLDDRGGGK